MRIAMFMVWQGVTPEEYDKVSDRVNWKGDVPHGAVLHIAAFDEGALHITDIWESEADFNNFVQNRLMPGVKELGLATQPETKIYPLHALFAPAFDK